MRSITPRRSIGYRSPISNPDMPSAATDPIPPLAPRIQRRGLAEQALERLEEMIETLQLAPGSMWTEASLASVTGFGRTPVREALKQLAARHLVNIVQRHGVQITEINVERQLLLLEMRRELARLTATRAARRRSEDEAAALAAYACQIRQIGHKGDVVAFFRVNKEADALAVEATNNPFLASALAPCQAMSRRFYFLHHRKAKDLQLACEHHAAVFEAIARGDEAQAARASEAVLDYAEQFTRASLMARF